MADFYGWECEEVKDRPLKGADSRQKFDLHLAALDWSLIEPIIINDSDDIKATNWRDRGLTPFKHQVSNLITFCRRLPVALIADDVGLGKTISGGLILSELIARKRVNRVLILCPKVLTDQWVAELDEKFGIVGTSVTGRELDREFRSSTTAVVTTYHSASDRLEKIKDDMFDMIIMDEAHKLRNLYGAANVPRIASNVRDVLEKRPFKFVLMLTATPIQNKIWDLYSLIDLLMVAEGKANPLGDKATFTSRYLMPGTQGRRLNPGREEQFQKIVRETLTRTRRADVDLNFPSRIITLRRVPIVGPEDKMVKVVASLINDLDALVQISLAQAMMSSPRALLKQAENMERNGTIEPRVVAELRTLAAAVPVPAKLKNLFTFIDELKERNPQTWRIVIFTVRIETQEMIGEELAKKGIAVGFIRGSSHDANTKNIAAYRVEPPRINVIVSTEAGAEGINLQAGNVLVNYDLPWNPMIIEQRIGRVQRLGSKFNQVVITNLVGADTVEERIVGRLTEKLQGIAQAIGDIEGILEMADMDPDGKHDSFEHQIRKMVVAALKGQNVEESRKKLERNIEEARVMFEERRQELDNQLGGDSSDNSKLPKPPKIDRKPPRLTAEKFVLGAKETSGFSIRQVSDQLYEATKAGSVPEKITFANDTGQVRQTGIFNDTHVHHYTPGKPHFERLVQHWLDHNAHFVQEPTAKDTDDLVQQLAKTWVNSKEGLGFVRVEKISSENSFKGLLHIRAKAGTGVDSYEKILRGRLAQPKEHGDLNEGKLQPVSGDLQVSKLIGNSYQDSLKKIVENDDDIKRFCGFYVDRLKDGVKKSGNDRNLIAKLAGDFKPYVQADVMGLEGIWYQVTRFCVYYTVDGAEYSSQITCVPISLKVMEEPENRTCSITQLNLPADCLVPCELSQNLALPHRLVKTDSGLRVLPSLISICAITGAKLLPSETLTAADGTVAKKELFVNDAFTGEMLLPSEVSVSEFSGKNGRTERLVESATSKRKAFPEETVLCSVTNQILLKDEAKKSQETGKWFALDQLVQSSLSESKGTPDEMVQCAKTGKTALPSELAKCSVSGKLVCKEQLVQSASTGNWLLPEEGDTTTSGQISERENIAICSVTGEKLLVNEMAKCRVSGLLVKPSVLVKSDYSNLFVIPNLLVRSELTGRCGLPDELTMCSKTRKKAHLSELVVCSVSSKRVCPDLLVISPVTGKSLLPEEGVVTSAGVVVEREFVGQCQETGDLILKSGLGFCSVTGKTVRLSLLEKSDISSLYCLAKYIRISKTSGKKGLPREGEICQVSGDWSLSSELEPCAVTGKRAQRKYFVTCSKTGARVLGEIASPLGDGTYACTRFLGKCDKTGRLLLKEKLARCQVSGLVVDKALLRKSDASEAMALLDEMVQTEEGQYALPEEISICPWDGKPHLKATFRTCTLTGFRAYWIHLNKKSELRDLRNLINSTTKGEPIPVAVCEKLSLNPEFRDIGRKSPSRILSPSGNAYVMVFLEKQGWFKTKTQIVGAVIRSLPGEEKIRGKICRITQTP
jgi:superfamily II DNA or RNA helicase